MTIGHPAAGLAVLGTPTSIGTVSCVVSPGIGLKRVRLNSPLGSARPAAAGGGFAARHQVVIGSVPVPAGGEIGATQVVRQRDGREVKIREVRTAGHDQRRWE